jgi:hypothetical protein
LIPGLNHEHELSTIKKQTQAFAILTSYETMKTSELMENLSGENYKTKAEGKAPGIGWKRKEEHTSSEDVSQRDKNLDNMSIRFINSGVASLDGDRKFRYIVIRLQLTFSVAWLHTSRIH